MASQEFAESKVDQEIQLLASRRRRLVLRFLIQRSTTATSIDELVAYIVENEHSDRLVNPQMVRTNLYHNDLPKLADHGLIDFDPRTGDLQFHPHQRIETLLEGISSD